jgi:hypothetical protein
MLTPQKLPELPKGFDPDAEQYPTLKRVLRKIEAAPELNDTPVDRVEVSCMANGEANVRVWKAKAEEPEVLHWPHV